MSTRGAEVIAEVLKVPARNPSPEICYLAREILKEADYSDCHPGLWPHSFIADNEEVKAAGLRLGVCVPVAGPGCPGNSYGACWYQDLEFDQEAKKQAPVPRQGFFEWTYAAGGKVRMGHYHLPRTPNGPVTSAPAIPQKGVYVQLDDNRRLVGIEINKPHIVTAQEINKILEHHGEESIDEKALDFLKE